VEFPQGPETGPRVISQSTDTRSRLPQQIGKPATERVPVASLLPEAMVMVRGTVRATMPALNLYEVRLNGGVRIMASYNGTSSGGNVQRLGASTITTLSSGTEVWVALAPGKPEMGAFIVGAANIPSTDYVLYRALSQYPQAAGIQFEKQGDGDTATLVTKHLYDQIYAKTGAAITNNNQGIADIVGGDWAVNNYYGGGLGVEAFRVWVSGGPMNGITFFLDREMTRVAGTNYELITMAEEYEDIQMARSLITTRRRVYTPSDSLFNNVPQLLEVEGQPYAGKTSFFSVRPKDNTALLAPETAGSGEPNPNDYVRSALIHEYRGIDGTYALTAAGSIILQKWVGVLLPQEVVTQPTDTEHVSDYPGYIKDNRPTPDINAEQKFETPTGDQKPREVITDDQDLALISDQTTIWSNDRDDKAIVSVASTSDIIAGIIGYQTTRAFLHSNMWKMSITDKPRYLRKPDGKTQWQDPVNRDPGMWQRVPKFFTLNLNSYGQSKRYFIGKAMIAITPEGGIMLQDAWGSQINMSGGNIYLTAEHSVIRNSGRDSVDISGRDHSVIAGRHLEQLASGGRASLVASTQLNLVGGMDGSGGVLVEALGETSSPILNGQTGEVAASDGGIVLNSRGNVSAIGKAVRMSATEGAIFAKAKGPMIIKSGNMVTAISQTGLWLSDFGGTHTDEGTSEVLVLNPHGSVIPSLRVPGVLFTAAVAQQAKRDNWNNTQNANPYVSLVNAYQLMDNNLVNPEVPAVSLKFASAFLSTANYGADTSGFGLPEAEWQRRLRQQSADNQVAVTYKWTMNFLNGSMPSPGSDKWSSDGFFKVASETTADKEYHLEHPTELPDDTPEALDGMLKGI